MTRRRGRSVHGGNLVVLDASALLAYTNGEARAALVERALGTTAICSVTASEVMAVLARFTGGRAAAHGLSRLGLNVIACDWDMAVAAAELHASTRPHGLSLGACMCLATALRLGVPVVTAEESWRALNVGVEVHVLS